MACILYNTTFKSRYPVVERCDMLYVLRDELVVVPDFLVSKIELGFKSGEFFKEGLIAFFQKAHLRINRLLFFIVFTVDKSNLGIVNEGQTTVVISRET